ncbi:AfsR/SARP family transcriptional regulator [Streptomyces sp. HPF1205]|uniref:AfsR/SARP family transcriptional regulator n=1 Tax=Streptomyces sp. HPF1205 TaxID=2873262 RepID=UPI001CECA6BC|nr:AfsR/SARP family transcriptional regulator [Streptomyces sp. HPF1205]
MRQLFNVLGPLQLCIDGHDRVPRGPKIQKACALLLLRANQVVETGVLTEELWAGEPLALAVSTLRTHIYHLRRALGPAAERLETRPGGYLLRVESGEVDAQVFARLVACGARELRGGDPAEAARLLGEALALWRGPALAGLACGPALAGELIHLAEMRRRAQELRIEADLRLGHHRMLVAELRTLVCADPLNEWAQARLIEALHGSGHRAAALAAFREAAQQLDEELGVAPSWELQRLHRVILAEGLGAPGDDRPDPSAGPR